MKNIKKLLALVLALAICAAFALPALATADETPENPDGTTTTENSLTVNGAVAGHKYQLYQVFTGDLYESILSNIKYGSAWGNVEGSAYQTGAKVPDEVLAEITGANETSAAADAFAKKYISLFTVPYGTEKNAGEGGTIVWTELPAGYYLVKDNGPVNGNIEGDTISAFIVEVVGEANANTKATQTTLDKTVEDKTSEYKHAVDQAVGKEFHFKLTATVPTHDLFQYSLSNPGDYTMTFTDTMSDGLDWVRFDTLKLNDTEKTITWPTVENGAKSFTVEFDLFKLIAAGDKVTEAEIDAFGDEIKVEITYTAKLNANAVVYPAMGEDNKPNWNKATLTYRNDPNGDGKGTTPDKEVYVYTFKIEGGKVNDKNEPLANAEFELFKEVTKEDGTTERVSVGTLTTNETGEILFEGLEAGKYFLVENKAPDGYNIMNEMEIVISAEYDDSSKQMKTYSQTAKQDDKDLTAPSKDSNGNPIWSVLNKSGSTLPSTGGMGTTILYIVGAVLVVGAGVVLFAKRRTSN